MNSSLVKQIEKEGKIMAEIRHYLLSIMDKEKADKKSEEFNNLFEKLHHDR